MEYRAKSQGYPVLNRTNAVTSQYAEVVRKVGAEMNVAVLDIWSAIMAKADCKPGDPFSGTITEPENEALKAMLHDGLHFTPEAYSIVYHEMMKLISERWPDQVPQKLPYRFPAWDDSAAWAKEGLQMGRQDVILHE